MGWSPELILDSFHPISPMSDPIKLALQAITGLTRFLSLRKEGPIEVNKRFCISLCFHKQVEEQENQKS
jgi:hypothetical protein